MCCTQDRGVFILVQVRAEALRCALGQDTVLSQCLSSLRCTNGYSNEFNAGSNPACDGLASHLGISRNTPSRFKLWKPEKVPAWGGHGPLGSSARRSSTYSQMYGKMKTFQGACKRRFPQTLFYYLPGILLSGHTFKLNEILHDCGSIHLAIGA